MSHTPAAPRTSLRGLTLVGALFAASLLSCGREITGPENGVGLRVAHGLSFTTEFPGPLASVEAGAGTVVAFNRVRVMFRRMDNSIALDRLVDFPEGQTEIALSLSVPLSNSAPAEGEPLQLFLRYINAAGDTVFSGGPVNVVAVPSSRDDQTQPTPVNVPVTYTGPGAEATTVTIAPDTVWVNAGQSFTFTATAHAGPENPVSAAPLVWTSLSPAMASLPSLTSGAGTALPVRGAARVRVALAAGGSGNAIGWADTAVVMIAPVAGSMSLFAGGNQTGGIGTQLANAVVVRVLATDGLPLAGATVTFAAGTGAGTVTPAIVVTDTAGRAAATWTLGNTVGAQTLSASVTGLTAVQVTATGEATAPTQLTTITEPPANIAAGIALPSVVAEVRNAANLRSLLYTDSVRIAIASGPAGAVLRGPRARLAVNGTVTFDSLSFTSVGSYTLAVTGTGLTPDTTSSITVIAGAPDSLVLASGGGQIHLPGAALPNPIVVRVADAFGNAVTGRSVTANPLTGGSVAPISIVTDLAGSATFVWTLANVSGTQTLRVALPSTTVAALDVLANDGPGAITITNVAPSLDTLTFVGQSATLTATSQDAALRSIAGTYTWRSLDDSIATVSAVGSVTAVKNGSARIVATEAGGTADTATVLVQQQVSSVTITPGTREIYLGASFDFSAQAVDGGGTPMLVQPPVTWSVQNAVIATVDTAGLVTGTSLGTTQLRALVGTIQGVAGITIRTPITRIAVLRDSVGFTQTDTFTIVALQRTRSYRVVAYDTLNAAMSGINFAIESSNPSVAILDSTGTTGARARAVANGLTTIRATAQGVVGNASLRVQQVLADIDLTPKGVFIAPTGAQLLTARGLDPDGYFLPSLTGVTFTSLQPSIATVGATSGLITGVSVGTAFVTASRDGILADTVSVTVGEGVPAVISFGRDSLAIGRSGSQSVPVYLSRPSASAVTVLLAVADTFAFFTQASVTINPGATSANATLNGRNAGLTSIRATDGSTVPTYAGDTALLAVQANVRFTTTSYSLVASNSLSTQILLSDPAPPGGAFIAYQYGTPGRVEISPDPAFIPAGQLAANVVITALAGGNTTVTPVTTGATGQLMTVFTYPATLNLNGTLFRLGLGQRRDDIYVQTQSNITQPLTVQLRSSDTSIVRVPSSATINAGGSFIYFNLQAAGPNRGAAWVYATATGWTSDSVQVDVNSPRVDVIGPANIQTTSPATNFSVRVRDSVGTQFALIAPLVVSLESSDTSIIRLSAATATIPAGTSSISGGSLSPAGGVGTARVRVSAPGHFADSFTVTVTGPKLSFGTATASVGAGQRNGNTYVQVPNNTTAPLLVTLVARQGGVISLPDTVYIPNGAYFRYFAFDGLVAGRDTVFASAAGHQPDTLVVTVSSPRLAGLNVSTYDNFRPPFNVSVSTQDSVGGGYPVIDTLVVSFTSSDTTVARVTPTARVLPGNASVNTAQITIVGEGFAFITATAPGYLPITDSLTVRTPKLSFSAPTYRLGRRQLSGVNSLYVQTPNVVTDALPVTITRSNPSVDSLLSSSDIPAGSGFRYFSIAALQVGSDTFIASAPGYLPDTMVVIVTTPRLSVSNMSTPRTTTSPPVNVSVSVGDSVGTSHPSMDTLVVAVTSSNPSVLQVTQPTYRILPNATTVSAQISYVGPGTAAIIVSDSAAAGFIGDTTNIVTVTGPALTVTNQTPRLGMRQHNGNFGAYVSVPNSITGSPLTVFLTSSDTSVVTVPASVQIPVGQTFAYFRVTALSSVATVQIAATAVGYTSANAIQEVTAPRFLISAPTTLRSTQLPGTVTVRAADANGNEHATTEDVVVTLASSAPSVAGFESATVTILANTSSNNQARIRPYTVGTTQLSVSDARTEAWRYSTATSNLAVTTPNLTLNWITVNLGVGQYVNATVNTSDAQRPPVLVTLARRTGTSLLPDTVTVDSAVSSRSFRIIGSSIGLDSVRATAVGHNPDSAAVNVGLGRVDGITGWPTTMSTDTVLVTLRTRDQDGTIRSVASATTFTLGVNANLKFMSAGAGPVDISSVTVPADANSVQFRLVRLTAGTANVSIANANYTTYNSTVTVNAP